MIKSRVLTGAQLKVFNVIRLAMYEAQADNYKVLTYDELKRVCLANGLTSFDGSFNAIYNKGYVFRYPDIKCSDGFLLSKGY